MHTHAHTHTTHAHTHTHTSVMKRSVTQETVRRGLTSDKWCFVRPGEEAQEEADNAQRNRTLAKARARASL